MMNEGQTVMSSSKSVPSDGRYSEDDANSLNAKVNDNCSKLLEEPARKEAGDCDSPENDQSKTASNSKDALKDLRDMQAELKTITEQANQSQRILSKLIEDLEKDITRLHLTLKNILEVFKQSRVLGFQGKFQWYSYT